MRFLKKILGRLNQQGVIHLIPLFLLLVGIIAGVYLVQHPQIFKPKAAQKSIEILPGDCVKEKDGKKVLVCDRFQFKITSPLETGQTSDAGSNMSVLPNIVKTAYAETFTNGYCKDDKSKIYFRLGSEEREGRFCRDNAECKEVEGGADCIKTVTTGGRSWVCKNNNTLQKCFFRVPVVEWCIGEETQTCPSDKPVCKADGNSATCVEKEQPAGQPAPVGGPPAPTCTNDIGCTDGNACTEDKCVDGKCVYSNKSAGSICGYDPSTREPIKECSSNGQCEAKKLAPAPAAQQPPVVPPGRPPAAGAPVITTPAVPAITVCNNDAAVAPPAAKDTPTNYKWTIDCSSSCKDTQKHSDCPKNDNDAFVCPSISNWCYDFGGNVGKKCLKLEYTGSRTPGQIPAKPAGECPERPASSETKVTPSPSPSPSPQTRTTTKFRLAANPTDLEKAPWYDYTAGGVPISAPSSYYSIGAPSFGIKSIYVQFLDNQLQKIKFSTGQDFTVANIEFVDIASIPSSSTQPAAGQQVACSSVTVLGSNQPGQEAVAQISYSGNPATLQLWMASNSEVGKSGSQVSSWTKVKDNVTPTDSIKFTLPSDLVAGSHAVLVSLHAADGSMLDGNAGGTVNSKCASSINIQSVTTTTPPASAQPAGQTFTAQCNSVSVTGSGLPGAVGSISLSYSGNPTYVQVWMAGNDNVGKDAGQVKEGWVLMTDYTAARKGVFAFNIPQDMISGSHVVLVALFDPQLNMLDGNPGGTVNTKCASSMTIQ